MQATGDLPEWLEFTENLEFTETPVPAHVSHDSDSERPTKVVQKSAKHRTETHFPQDRNAVVVQDLATSMDSILSVQK